MSDRTSDITFIIVNYRSTSELMRCLFDLSKLSRDHAILNTLIINNDTESLAVPPHKGLSITIQNICHNIGYGAANNIGLRHVTSPYVCFLNPDTHSFSSNFLSITEHINQRTLVSPCIKTEDGSPQKWSCGDKITFLQLIKNHLHIHSSPWNSSQKTPVHWVSGAALCGYTSFLRSIGGFDEDFFLYFEDTDLCERTLLRGGSVFFLPHIFLTHTSGQSTKSDCKKQKKCYYRSQDIFFHKHSNRITVYMVRFFRFFLLFR
jgi:GT2 family glycosyltransferase